MTKFLSDFFSLKPHFGNEMFAEFVLHSKFRIAVFKPVGASAKFFQSDGNRDTASFGVTTHQIDRLYDRAVTQGVKVSGPPKDHPWGEKSFLLIDPDGNRWEITESPSPDGMLVNR